MPEWLRGLTRNQMRSPRVGSNPTGDVFLFTIPLKMKEKVAKTCRSDPGSNQGPLDLQSNALPTELSKPMNYEADTCTMLLLLVCCQAKNIPRLPGVEPGIF